MEQDVNQTESDEIELAASDGSAEAEAVPAEDLAAAIARELEARVAERDALQDQMLRLRAEFDNYRKRTAREIERIRKTAAESLLRELLPVLDNLERALAHAGDTSGGLERGVEMVLVQLKDILARTGLEAIPALGEPFDPNVHEALSHLPSEEHAADTVMEEFSRGYRIGNYSVRPATVVVSSGPPAPDAENLETEEAN